MKKMLPIVLLALITLPCLAADDSAPRLHFPTNGFSIAPLEETSGAAAYQAVIMFLPVTETFAPNVNVRIQPYEGTIEAYADLSKREFQTYKLTIVSEHRTATSMTWEYTGTMQDRKLHWYAKAELGDGKIYLATATATETQWEAVGAKLKACIDSFKLEKAE